MRRLSFLFLVVAAAAATTFSQESQSTVSQQTDAATALSRLKALSGSWHGTIMGVPIDITIRAASSGTAVIYEANTLKGPPDHEITMFYVEDGRLVAVHYCDAGNRARLEGKLSPDGKALDSGFIDVSGPTKGGLVKRISISFSSPDKHVEEFTFIMPNGKPIELRGEFTRTN